MRADGDAPPPDPASKPQAPPDLGEALHALGADSRAGLKAASDSLKALRILVAADFSLARSAFGRA
ncbi:MAG TPA: phage holin family protein, partial [Thermomonas sp.]|nr:phage holin family protein [Thermomonas sp.]